MPIVHIMIANYFLANSAKELVKERIAVIALMNELLPGLPYRELRTNEVPDDGSLPGIDSWYDDPWKEDYHKRYDDTDPTRICYLEN